MTVDLSPLTSLNKLLFDIPVAPVQGSRFQPTGFPDLGAATYETEGGTCLLVESAQSMANRLEATCWDDAGETLVSDVAGLSYVRVTDEGGKFLTSSLLEAHRINSVYIEKGNKGAFHKSLATEYGWAKDKPINRVTLVRALFKFDVGSLLHGVFLESIDGRLRIARAMSAFIEAEGVRVAASGGVKNDRVKPGTESKDGEEPVEKKTAKEGYGNVPFHRDEYTARSMTLFANIDLAQIRGYGLDEKQTRLLILLALFKLRTCIDGSLRLRSACDLETTSENISAKKGGFVLPDRKTLAAELKESIKACGAEFAKNEGVTTVVYAG